MDTTFALHWGKMKIRKIIRIVWISLGITFMIWSYSTFQSRDLPIDTYVSTEKIEVVESDNEIVFIPKQSASSLEVIFFQGGLVDPDAYAPFARQIARAGFTFHLIKASWRFPQYDYEKISEMFDLSSGTYVIGGHSQGAKTAAQFVFENPDKAKGLFLFGTTHPRDINLSELTIPTLKLYAEFDGLASIAEVMHNKAKLPPNTRLSFIKGGNHSQFGHMGKLFFDDDATISRDEQQALVKSELISFLRELDQKSWTTAP
jgi:pimeloyl-ACP methyl ester carboxylesterase